MYIHTYVYIYIHMNLYIHIYVCICMYVCVCVHTHIYHLVIRKDYWITILIILYQSRGHRLILIPSQLFVV